ncbi:MAG: glycosyltransferase [Actinomycetota bacterium]|nr:glycosyltransferase [Actinomycetota bacterium]
MQGNDTEREREPEVSVVIITVGRENTYKLVPLVLEQKTSFDFEVLLIVNGPIDEKRLKNEAVRIVKEKSGLGIPYYRNRGTEEARGRVIVYIDDDETPMDENWLEKIALPVVSGEEKVAVSGYYVPLGQGFFSDLVSMLGYPGGGSLGWRAICKVDENGYTDKFPSGNCAIEKSLLEEVGGFHPSLTIGTEDVYLGEQFLERGVRMLYVEEATVYHEPRKGFREFMRWQFGRGRAMYDLRKLKKFSDFQRPAVSERLVRTYNVLKDTFPSSKFLPMCGIFFLEYFLHGIGYMAQWFKRSFIEKSE